MKLKSVFLTSLLTLLFIGGVVAQDKYEFATVKLRGVKIEVATSANSSSQVFELGKDDFEVAIIRKVEEMNQQGWEVYNVTYASVGASVYYLRRKKN
jgi:hypothetical protein